MRAINSAVIHCSATREGANVTRQDIYNWHTWPLRMSNGNIRYLGQYYKSVSELPVDVQNHWGRGWIDIGYNFIVMPDGTIVFGRPIEKVGAHTQGHNLTSIGIVYVGGLGLNGKPKDTRTGSQKLALRELLEQLCEKYPIKSIKGHRDYSPDIDKDGVIESWEWIKDCPCFDAQNEYKSLL